jgi:ribosomal-protein-alanine N-acetyltransferase
MQTKRVNGKSAEKYLCQNVPAGYKLFIAGVKDVPVLSVFSASFFADDLTSIPVYSKKAIENGHFLAFGLKDKNGSVTAACAIEMNIRQKRIYIVEFGVAPVHQGKGLGRWILQSVENLAQQFGYRHIASHIEIDNESSRRLHEHFGFSVQKRVKSYYDDGSDGYYMRKTLLDDHDL